MSEPRILEIERRLTSLAAEMRATGRRTAALEQRGIATTGAGGGGAGTGGGSVRKRYGVTTASGIGAYSGGPATGPVSETDSNFVALSPAVSFPARNSGTTAVGNSKRVICLDDGVNIDVIWEDCG